MGEGRREKGRKAQIALLIRYRRPLIVVFHAALVAASLVAAFLLRFDMLVPSESWSALLKALPVLLAIRLLLFAVFGLFEGLWRYVSVKDLVSIGKATLAGSVLFIAIELSLIDRSFPRSVFALEALMTFMTVGGIRFLTRAVRENRQVGRSTEGRRALVVGAGDGAERLVRSIQSAPEHDYVLVGLIDDDRRKYRTRIRGISVVGDTSDIPSLVARLEVDEVLIAVPSASPEERRRIVQLCREASVPVRSVPSLRQLVEGRARIGQLENVDPATLIARDEIRIDLDRIRRDTEDRVVLVTGAGGSIGSELCRQLAPFSPGKLILLDRAESSLYFTNMELTQRYPDVEVKLVIGDICDEHKMQAVMDEHKPQIVYHAAAYKHVPLMEAHPLEAIQNNVFGTEIAAWAAIAAGVRKFVLISTDKAVAPLGVMGMTKRLAEGVLLAAEKSGDFVSVRFGNVLGSAGSVMPIFHWQLSQGSPVTVTDQEATRYFMLLSEAAQLVIQAGAMGTSADVFFLDMGAPVRIGQLAEDFIRLSGLSPDKSTIRSVGLRPGEKVAEQLVAQTEDLGPSDHEKIYRLKRREFDAVSFNSDLALLRSLVQTRNEDEALRQLREMADRY